MKVWLAVFTLLIPVAFAQDVLHGGESNFEISIRGGKGVAFRGSCLSTRAGGGSITTKLEGTVPSDSMSTVFRIAGTAVYLTVQNQSSGKEPEVRVDGDGKTVLDTRSPSAQAGPFLEVAISERQHSKDAANRCAPRSHFAVDRAARHWRAGLYGTSGREFYDSFRVPHLHVGDGRY